MARYFTCSQEDTTYVFRKGYRRDVMVSSYSGSGRDSRADAELQRLRQHPRLPIGHAVVFHGNKRVR